jgi:hypothetical protein
VVLGPDQPTTSYGNGTSTPADRTAFFHTNVARMIALKWMNLPFLSSKVPVKVNLHDVCNAFWDGSSLNFFKAGDLTSGSSVIRCKNTGEIRDVMQHLISYIQNNLKCEDIKLVEADLLPEESIKRDPTDPEGTGPATYENWVATYCGTSTSFLVVFWASKEGGTMFRIALRPAKK